MQPGKKDNHARGPASDRIQLGILLLPAVLLCTACGGAVQWAPMSAAEVAERGTLVLAAPRQTVLDACVLALRKQGYTVDAAEPETGLVVTARRAAPESGAPEHGLHRAYVLEVKSAPNGGARVSAWPAISEADTARGVRRFEAPVWDLTDERASWSRLFEDIRAIVEKASP